MHIKKRRDLMVSMIAKYFPEEIKYTKPEGGMFSWITLPEGISSLDLVDRAIKDDALMIREEMLNADGLIFVSPVYAHQVTALMKNFIDRFAYVLHRPCFLDIRINIFKKFFVRFMVKRIEKTIRKKYG